MAWYLVIDKDNNLVSSGSSVADDKTLRAKGYRKIELAGEPPENTQWDPAAGKMAQRPPKPVRVSRTEFLKRFTVDERTAIRKAANRNDVVSDLLYMLEVTEPVTLGDPLLVQGMEYLVAQGLITASRRQEIMNG